MRSILRSLNSLLVVVTLPVYVLLAFIGMMGTLCSRLQVQGLPAWMGPPLSGIGLALAVWYCVVEMIMGLSTDNGCGGIMSVAGMLQDGRSGYLLALGLAIAGYFLTRSTF